MSSDLRASHLVFASAADLRETVRGASACTLHPETDDHLRKAVSASDHREANASGDRETSSTGDRETGGPSDRSAGRPAQSRLSDLSETDGVVRADLSETDLLRAHVPQVALSGAQGLPEEVRTTGDASDSQASNFLSRSVSSAESGAGAGTADQLREARPAGRSFPAYLPNAYKTVLPLRENRGQMSRCDCND